MISGIKIDLSSLELQDLLNERVQYHEAKITQYQKQAEGLRGVGKAEGQSFDPEEQVQRKVEDHRHRFALFTFPRDHLIPNETYRLEETDLIRLELLSRY